MAVYTALEQDALHAWLASHDVGTLIECHGIVSGIENSNFFITTRDGSTERHFVLTLFERLSIEQLPVYLALMRHLAARGVPCPVPIADRDGALHSRLAGKPAALVTRLDGRSVMRPTPAHCAAIGSVLARLHIAGASFEADLPNPRGIDWWLKTAQDVRDFLDDPQRALLDEEVALVGRCWKPLMRSLPCGAIHADLFRDNALFEQTEATDSLPQLRGVIDFYFAGNDIWLLDVAISINDWCVDPATGALDPPRLDALIDAYENERPMMAAEREALPQALRAAALRFWLSRLDDLHRPRPAQILTPHDPAHFERLLRMRRGDALSSRRPFDRPPLSS